MDEQNLLPSLVFSKSDETPPHFPSDERIRELTSKACKEGLEFVELEDEERKFVVEELKIPDLVMPTEFRNSIFNSYFKVKKLGTSIDMGMEVKCCFCANFNGDDF